MMDDLRDDLLWRGGKEFIRLEDDLRYLISQEI